MFFPVVLVFDVIGCLNQVYALFIHVDNSISMYQVLLHIPSLGWTFHVL
jgi:hypothetical protein